MKRGIVIGKFYPPHKGHKFLIEKALSEVESLTVIVCDRKDQAIDGTLRKRWLQEMAPKAKVIVIDDCLPDDDSQAWAIHTKEILGYTPDVVFTSEDYGYAYSQYLGCRHVQVDKERKTVPISATQVRRDPYEHWEYIEPCVRAYFAKRICLVGAESTGKTTFAKALAKHFETVWVPEFGRTYSEGKMLSSETVHWMTDEFIYIAKQQNEMEDQYARICNKILICDTDSFATSLWHERYMGYLSSEVENINHERNIDLYLLMNVDCPFVQDGLRDGEHVRERMHERFKEELIKRNKNYLILSGTYEAKLEKAIQACHSILSKIGSSSN